MLVNSWEQRKLGDVVTLVNGRAYKQSELLEKGKFPVLRVGNFYTNNTWYYSNLELEDKYYANNGDLLYTWAATFGPHIWTGERVIFHYHIWKIELSALVGKKFLLQLLYADREELLNNTNGSTMIHVTKKEMENKQVLFPKIDEQNQIGSFFKIIDSTIASNQQQQKKPRFLKKSWPISCYLYQTSKVLHYLVIILILKFLNNMQISLLSSRHIRMTQTTSHRSNTYPCIQ